MPSKRRFSKSKSTPKNIDIDHFRNYLKIKSYEADKSFKDNYPNVHATLIANGISPSNLRKHSGKLIGTSLITGSLLFATPVLANNISYDPLNFGRSNLLSSDPTKENQVVDILKSILPKNIRPLNRNEEKILEQVFSETIGVKVKATLEGEHLNTTYGRIGLEQHLRRYPGDSLSLHGSPQDQEEGMAPGLGAWGYFAQSKESLTPSLVETEKWYAVVQTLYLHDWNTRQPYLKNWYKYRKVMIINTVNGNAVVAAIADSGPAAWTGKHFGGSPEVMNYLGGTRYTKGPVVIFFVDDPENKIPLGPVQY